MTRSTWIRLGGVSLLFSGLWLAFTQQAAPLRIDEVRKNLHVIYGSGGNVAVLTTPAGAVLVDSKFDRNVPEILSLVKSVTDQPVRYVFNTHHHGDHSGGNAQLGQTAQLITHENARDNMAGSAPESLPTLSFSDRQSLHLGEMEVQALHFGRSHTDGDAVIFFPQLGVIHTGDMFVRSAPFIDYSSGGSAVEWDDTLNEVLQLEFTTVIPGHGAVSTREDLSQWKADFASFRDQVGGMVDDGKTAAEIQSEVDFSGLDGWSMSGLLERSMPGLVQELR